MRRVSSLQVVTTIFVLTIVVTIGTLVILGVQSADRRGPVTTGPIPATSSQPR